MQKRLLIVLATTLAILITSGFALAAESVRIVQNLDNISARLMSAQSSGGTSLSLGIPAVAINSITLNSTEYKEVSLPAADHLFPAALAEDGKPDIPVLTTMIIIPDQVGVQVNVTYSEYDTFDNIDLAPVQPSKSDSNPNEIIPFTIDQNVYSTDEFYPSELATAAEPIILRDVRAIQISLNPVQYNPVTRQLRVYRDLEVGVTYGGEAINPKSDTHPLSLRGFLSHLQEHVCQFRRDIFQCRS